MQGILKNDGIHHSIYPVTCYSQVIKVCKEQFNDEVSISPFVIFSGISPPTQSFPSPALSATLEFRDEALSNPPQGLPTVAFSPAERNRRGHVVTDHHNLAVYFQGPEILVIQVADSRASPSVGDIVSALDRLLFESKVQVQF